MKRNRYRSTLRISMNCFCSQKLVQIHGFICRTSIVIYFHVTIILMTTFVQIVVNVPAVSGIFDYAIPESLIGQISVGDLVIVPFGNKSVQGVVFRFIHQPSVQNVKEIAELVDPIPVMTQAQIALAEAMAESTFSSLAAVV